MPSIADIRQQYPQYSDMSDQQLADGFHNKYYSDIPKDQFYQSLGVSSAPQEQGFLDRLGQNFTERGQDAAKIADQAILGQISTPEAVARGALKYAQVPFDTVGREILAPVAKGLYNATAAQPVKEAVSDVGAYLANPTEGSMVDSAVKAYKGFEERHPVALSRIGSALDVGNIVAPFAPVGEGKSLAGAAMDNAVQPIKSAGNALEKVPSAVRQGIQLGPDQQLLENAGISLTPGQRSGEGLIKGIENRATSIPLVGDAINSSYRRGIDDLNRAVANDILSSVGEKLPEKVKIGRDSVSHVYETLGKKYDDVLSGMVGDIKDPQFQSEITALKADALNRMPKDRAEQYARSLDDAINKNSDNGIAADRQNKDIMRRLKEDARTYTKSGDADQQRLGEFFNDALSSYSDMLQRNNPIEKSQALKDADLAYAKYVRLEQAAGAAGAKDGVFTPSQLLSAVKRTDNSARKGAFSRGDALMQPLAEAANNVLPNTVPDSGSAGRALTAAMLAGTVIPNPISPLFAIGALGSAAYTRPGQNLLTLTSKKLRGVQ